MDSFEESAGRIARSMGSAARRVEQPTSFLLGEVVSVQPFRIRAGGLVLDSSSLRINEALLKGYVPKLTGTLYGSCPDGSAVTSVQPENLSRGEDALKPGDTVVVLSSDRQIYYILCKVVAVP